MAYNKSSEVPSSKSEGDFIRYHVNGGKGRDRGKPNNNRFWRGDVYFINEQPWVRYMGRVGRQHMFIHRSWHNYPFDRFDRHWESEFCAVAEFVYAPDVGVFSKYEGDWLTREQTHDRVKLIMLHQIREFSMETVPAMTGPQLIAEYVDWGRNGYSAIGKYARRPWGHCVVTADEMLEGRYSKFVDRWIAYKQAFELDWGSVPQMYEDHYLNVVKEKRRKYLDPKSVVRRERVRARKIAEKALDLRSE